MQIAYTNVNGYLVPTFAAPGDSSEPIGKYGSMRAQFLDLYRPFERDQMLLDGTLTQHLSEVDREVHFQVGNLTNRLAKQHGVTEDLKLRSPLEWAAQMQMFHAQAEEIVCSELIYV